MRRIGFATITVGNGWWWRLEAGRDRGFHSFWGKVGGSIGTLPGNACHSAPFVPSRLMCSDVDVPRNETRGRKERKKVEGEPFGYKVASFDNLIRDQDRMIGRG